MQARPERELLAPPADDAVEDTTDEEPVATIAAPDVESPETKEASSGSQ